MTTLEEFIAKTPCQICDELKFAKFKRMNGETAKSVRFRSDTGAEREINTLSIPMEALDAEIAKYQNLCDVSKGLSTTGRRRFTYARSGF